MENETFRFVFRPPIGKDVIIRLTPRYLIVKKGNLGGIYYNDDSKLNKIEGDHFHLLQTYFPIDTLKDVRRKFLKEAVNQYPKLLDASYYKKLFEKSLTDNRVTNKWGNQKYGYHETFLPISIEEYKNIVQEINASGFWKLPYEQIQESPSIMDDPSFSLEANTKYQYQITTRMFDFDDTSKFTVACQHLIDLAGLHDELKIVYPYPGTVSY